jgi:retron-type reverse transcriptase
VRDRLLHHAIYRKLYPFFDRTFIADSFSCRIGKGTHKALERFRRFAYQASKNNTRTCWVLKCDIRKFFDSIDQEILVSFMRRKITGENMLWLVEKILKSFKTESGKGLPLGNVTSQLFANVYLNELDWFVKHTLKARYYIRYCDDFVILENSHTGLEQFVEKIRDFLRGQLLLELHPHKVTIRKLRQGTDFLGYVSLQHYRVLRTRTKRRMLARVNQKNLQSYLGVLTHCKGCRIFASVMTRLDSTQQS